MIINTPVDRGNEIEVVKNTLGYTVGKNLLENTATTTTIKGVTCTVNDDGSVTLNGTATGGHVNFSIKGNFYLPNGEYILSGCPKGGTTSTYYLALYDGKKTCNDIGEGGTFVVNDNILEFVRIVVLNGQTVNNLTFYPMIRKASITDDTYEPCSGVDVDTRLNSILEWKLVGSVTGKTTVNLPSTFRELYIEVEVVDSTNTTMHFSTAIIPRIILTTTTKTYLLPIIAASKAFNVRIDISTTSVIINDIYYGGNSVGDDCKLRVYYR
jgi:hypothetical protein